MVTICKCASSDARLLYILLRSGKFTSVLSILILSCLCAFAMCFSRFGGVLPVLFQLFMQHCHWVGSALCFVCLFLMYPISPHIDFPLSSCSRVRVMVGIVGPGCSFLGCSFAPSGEFIRRCSLCVASVGVCSMVLIQMSRMYVSSSVRFPISGSFIVGCFFECLRACRIAFRIDFLPYVFGHFWHSHFLLLYRTLGCFLASFCLLFGYLLVVVFACLVFPGVCCVRWDVLGLFCDIDRSCVFLVVFGVV